MSAVRFWRTGGATATVGLSMRPCPRAIAVVSQHRVDFSRGHGRTGALPAEIRCEVRMRS